MPDTIDDVNEHPIIFNEWSINRILAGEKTQTRRIVKPQPHEDVEAIHQDTRQGDYWFAGTMNSEWDPVLWQEKSPYGQPGDVLWVREAFRLIESCDPLPPSEAGGPVKYCADGWVNTGKGLAWGKKRPSIHMPKELCRLRLRVEDVRVERVKQISRDDALAEGIKASDYEGNSVRFEDDLRLQFADKWRKIHGDGAWDRNDWVWVIEFSRINNNQS